MPTAFELKLKALRARVNQVQHYHAVPKDYSGDEVIAHFTALGVCHTMLQSAAPGLSLWAGNSNCLNDALEGKALLRFAELAVTDSRLPDASTPPYISGRWPRLPWDTGPKYDSEIPDTPYVLREDWEKLSEALATLYNVPPLTLLSGNTELQTYSPGVHLVSFCREKDRLDLWRMYAKDATGICMAMPLREAIKSVGRNWRFFFVAYDERAMARAWALLLHPLLDAVNAMRDGEPELRIAQGRQILSELDRALYLFKHEQFRSEREVRLLHIGGASGTVKMAGERETVVIPTESFFLNSPGCSVILGPRAPHRNVAAAVLSVKLGVLRNKPTLLLSGLPYQDPQDAHSR